MQSPDVKPPTPDEVGRLQASIAESDPELLMFVRLSAMTGARRSEVIAIRWPDLDLDEAVVTISRGVVMGPSGLVEKDTKTHQARRVALDPDTVRMLVAHQAVGKSALRHVVPSWPATVSSSARISKVVPLGTQTRCHVVSVGPASASGWRA